MTTSRLLGLLAALFVRVYRPLYRTVVFGEEHLAAIHDRDRRALFALWHGRMFAPILHHRNRGVVTMASRSNDGEIITGMLETIGYEVARGSTGKRGAQALVEMVERVRGGRDAALTVDGPRGPAEIVQPGIVKLARETGALILPISSACRRGKRFASWDRFLLPLPFDTAFVVHGAPLEIGADEADEAACARIGAALQALTAEAEGLAHSG